MRDAINELNKNSISQATGISYGRLRKYSAGLVDNLRPEEKEKIYKYLIDLAERFNQDKQEE